MSGPHFYVWKDIGYALSDSEMSDIKNLVSTRDRFVKQRDKEIKKEKDYVKSGSAAMYQRLIDAVTSEIQGVLRGNERASR